MMKEVSQNLKEYFKPIWFDYSASNQIIEELNHIIEMPMNHRPQNLLIISETNNGKTIIAKRFLKKHPARIILDEEGEEKLVMEILMLQCPYVADEKLLFMSFLDAVNIGYKASTSKANLLSLVISAIKRLGLRVIILDELQHLLSRASKQRDILNLLKYISNETSVSFIGVGTKEAFYVINSDPQLANRFNKSVLPKWNFNNEFLGVLSVFQNEMSLKGKEIITAPDFARRIFDLGEGLIGEYVTILRLIWKYAIEHGSNEIHLGTIEQITYTRPSERRKDNELYD